MRDVRAAFTRAADLLLPNAERRRTARLQVADAGHGYDEFGMQREASMLATALLYPLYRYYFRVTSTGAEHLPEGPAILAANHGGLLPFDGAMLGLDVCLHTEPPRLPRIVVDFFVPKLPLVGTLLSRIGIINGAPSDVALLLQRGELVALFPEGMRAIGKPAHAHYSLVDWRVGHAEIALRLGVPIVPVALIGPAEQWSELTRLEALHPFGIPYLPIPWTPFPLPVHYHIYYGAPLTFPHPLAHPTAADVYDLARRSREAVEALIARGLLERRGRFR